MALDVKDIAVFLLDMDGTFNLGENAIPGSLEFIEKVLASGRDYLFLTNNSSHNAAYYVERLRRMGLDAPRSKILTSGEATAAVVARDWPGRSVLLLGNGYLREEFEEAGVPLKDGPEADIAVLGFDTTLDYDKMARFCSCVRSGKPYIATHPDLNCPTPDGFIPDAGAIIAFVRASTGRDPDLIVGKPYPGIVEAVLRRTGRDRREMAMVGDRLYTDIAVGRNSGITSVLVMTGETTQDMLEASEIKPDMVFSCLGEIAEHL